jgi:hypothetical protein
MLSAVVWSQSRYIRLPPRGLFNYHSTTASDLPLLHTTPDLPYLTLDTRHSTINFDINHHQQTNLIFDITISTKMPSYHITEPHPSVPASHIYYAGRGGAGNATRVKASDISNGRNASGPASLVKLTPPPSNAFFTSGRGGAGNVHREKERAMFSFDEELAQQERLREHAAPIYHVGRGGAGNAINEMKPQSARNNSTSSHTSVDSEKEGVRRSIEGAWNKVSRQFSR